MDVPDPLQEAEAMLRRRGFDVTIVRGDWITVTGCRDASDRIKIDKVRGGWRVEYEHGNDSFASVVSHPEEARRTAADWTAGQFGVTHGQYDEFPEDLQACVDDLLRRGFDVVFGESESDRGGVAFRAERGGITIVVADWGQTWGVTLDDGDRPDVEECWDRPARVADEVERWIDEFTD